MNHLDIRKAFKDYFTDSNHQWIDSAPLIPHNDPTLLFVNAGMNQFKNIFLNTESSKKKNLISIQKCVRVDGKHNDLEQVGISPYHHTFFEMIGNFSFDGYFKEKACRLAWDFLTKKINLPEDSLSVTVFKDDKETEDIWSKKIKLKPNKISSKGEEDNFWRMGSEGPCGPCTEIFYTGKDLKKIEVWNLVFMEYYESKEGERKKLKTPCIDTGMGLERLASILQQKSSNFEIDLFQPIINCASQILNIKAQEPFNKNHSHNTTLRILADHIKASVFLMSDGVAPSNEGRGYVLRRLLRRAIYSASLVTDKKSFLKDISKPVFDIYKEVYPEINLMKETIQKNLSLEEDKFFHTLDQGKVRIGNYIQEIKKSKSDVLDGKTAFHLYDTYGFPIDLVIRICNKKGIKVDQAGFDKWMKESRLKSKKQSQFQNNTSSLPNLDDSIKPSKFVGYEKLDCSSKLVALFDTKNQQVEKLSQSKGFAVFNKTCFYPEGGGQIGDQGEILNVSNEVIGEILDCKKIKDHHIHFIKLKNNNLELGKKYTIKVNSKHRKNTAIHHSATHLLHSALRKILGVQTKQSGSLVEPSRLRFDFTHNAPLTKTQYEQIEDMVNEQISKEEEVMIEHMDYNKALKSGALSFFDKPTQKVRVLTIGSFSKELCGGTHVQNTKEIKYFKIINENSIGSGIRRIEAICGDLALKLITELSRENIETRKLLQLSESPDSTSNPLIEEFQKQKDVIKEQQGVIKKLKKSNSIPENINIEVFNFNSQSISFHCKSYPIEDSEELFTLIDSLKEKYPSFLGVLIGKSNGKNIPIAVSVPKSISTKLTAQKFIENLGGKGGGPPTFAKGALDTHFQASSVRKYVLDYLHKNELAQELK